MFRGSALLVCAIIVFCLFFGPALGKSKKGQKENGVSTFPSKLKVLKKSGANKLKISPLRPGNYGSAAKAMNKEFRRNEIPQPKSPQEALVLDPELWSNKIKELRSINPVEVPGKAGHKFCLCQITGNYYHAFKAGKRTARQTRGLVKQENKEKNQEKDGEKAEKFGEPGANYARPGKYVKPFDPYGRRNQIADPKSPRQTGDLVEKGKYRKIHARPGNFLPAFKKSLGPGADPQQRPGDYGTMFPVAAVTQPGTENITIAARNEIPTKKTPRQIPGTRVFKRQLGPVGHHGGDYGGAVRRNLPGKKLSREYGHAQEAAPSGGAMKSLEQT